MAYHLLAYAEIEAGNGEEALALLERGRALFGSELGRSDDARFSLDEARALMAARGPAEAAKKAARTLELVDALAPGDRGTAYMALADIFAAAGDVEKAKMLLEQSLELLSEHFRPRALDAGRRLADLLEQQGDTAGALKVLKRATEAASSAAAPPGVTAGG
jgi:tetratricopeptide (TPR) repeat protein